MKAPVTFQACFTFPNEMILCPCNRVGDGDTDRMNQPAGLLSEYYGRRPGHIVCAHFQPQEAVHTDLLLNVPRCLDRQPAGIFKKTNNP